MSASKADLTNLIMAVLANSVEVNGGVGDETPLAQVLDSLGLLGFLADIEDEVLARFATSVSLDMTSYEGDAPPWDTVATLAAYLDRTIQASKPVAS